MKITLNDTRKKVLEVLKNAREPLALSEISELIGKEVKTGTTNAMIEAGMIKVTGTKKVAKTIYVEVNAYTIGDIDTSK